MRRVVIIGNSLAAAKVATRFKRNEFTSEVNIIVPAVDENAGRGPFASAYAKDRALADLLAMRDVGVVEAHDLSIDFDAKTVFPVSTRGRIAIRYNELVLALDAEPRIPRALRKADNVFAWPCAMGSAIDTLLNTEEDSDTEKRVVVLGQGEAALEALRLVAESGQVPVWVRVRDMGPASFDAMVWAKAEAMAAESGIEIYDWSQSPVEKMALVCDDNGALRSLTMDGTSVAGDVFLWTAPTMVQHPVLAQEGVSLDGRGRIVVDANLSTELENVFMLGTGIAIKDDVACPMVGNADVMGLARKLADKLAGFDDMPANMHLGAMYADCLGFSMSRAGISLARAAEREVEVEFALLPLGKENGGGLLQLVAGKGAKTLLGYQVIGSASAVAMLAPMLNVAVEQHLSVAMAARMPFVGQAGAIMQKTLSILDNKLSERIFGITPEELEASRQAGAEFFVLDLRSLPEWKEGHIAGAYNIPFAQLGKRLQDEVPRYTTIVLACNRGNKAWSVASKMRGLGATSLYVLDGGMECWNLALEQA